MNILTANCTGAKFNLLRSVDRRLAAKAPGQLTPFRRGHGEAISGVLQQGAERISNEFSLFRWATGKAVGP